MNADAVPFPAEAARDQLLRADAVLATHQLTLPKTMADPGIAIATIQAARDLMNAVIDQLECA